MMLLERWLVAAVVGLTVLLAPVANGVSGQQQSGTKSTSPASGQDPAPAKAVLDPNAPPPPDDPKAQPPKRDDDLAPEPDLDEVQSAPDTAAPAPAPASVKSQPVEPAKPDLRPVTPPSAASAPAARPSVSPVAATADNHFVKPATPAVKAWPPEGNGKYDHETAQLQHLAQELKLEIEKAGANTLSLAALRKAEEIQRIARDLKEKMKDQGQTVAAKP
jgi:hypothetical protein